MVLRNAKYGFAAAAIVLVTIPAAGDDWEYPYYLVELNMEATSTVTFACTPDCDNSWSFCTALAGIQAWAHEQTECYDEESEVCNNSGDTYCTSVANVGCVLGIPIPHGYYEAWCEAGVEISSCGQTITTDGWIKSEGYAIHGGYTPHGGTNSAIYVPCSSSAMNEYDSWSVVQELAVACFAYSDPNDYTPLGYPAPLSRSVSLLKTPASSTRLSAGLLTNGIDTVGRGLTLSGGIWEGTLSASGTGPITMDVSTQQFDYRDVSMDVNEDGRFNELDVTALTVLIGSTDPDHLAKWDFDEDDEIDSDDVALMEALVELEWDSGLLGDADGDGDLDCDDLDGLPGTFDYILSDAEYQPELDDNLDGVLDEDDRHWVYHAVLPGDIDADGDVDLSDMSALLSSYNKCEEDPGFNPYADIDRDGCVGLSDLAALQANYNESCN